MGDRVRPHRMVSSFTQIGSDKDNQMVQVTSAGTEGSSELLAPYTELPFYSKQIRIALKNCGIIDPKDIAEYIARDGYRALERALTGLTPDEVITIMKDSGLRGRGGAGFATGIKWEFCRRSRNTPK